MSSGCRGRGSKQSLRLTSQGKSSEFQKGLGCYLTLKQLLHLRDPTTLHPLGPDLPGCLQGGLHCHRASLVTGFKCSCDFILLGQGWV